jgi:hypothetical protein
MSRPLRSEVFLPGEVTVVHVVQQCVRNMHLIGLDETTGEDYSYRQEWIRQRLEKLASVFAVDVLSYAILSNHFHVVLRSRPDIVTAWSDKEAALRWMQLFQGKRSQEQLESPTTSDVQSLANDSERLAVVRSRLSDLSWFMKSIAEPISRRANSEEKMTGPFWEGGFKAQRLLDEVGTLVCCMHVDLNLIRISQAKSIRESKFTSAFDRWKASQGVKIESAAVSMRSISQKEAAATRDKVKETAGPKVLQDAWLAPLPINPGKRGPVVSKTGYRASDKGFLNMTLENYLELLEFTSLHGRVDKRAVSPSRRGSKFSPSIAEILSTLGIEEEMWCELVWNYKKYYGRSRGVGSPQTMTQDAEARNRAFHHGQRTTRSCFKSNA